MDGYEVLPMEVAAAVGDIFCTATGDKNVIIRAHMERMKDGAILANTGHFNVEIEIGALRDLAVETREARALVDEYTLADGRRLYLIGEGRLVNLAAAEGHPALVMDMSFANQALAAEWVIRNAATLERKVYDVPKDIDDEIARLKLETMGISIDQLTEEQAKYLASWDEGPRHLARSQPTTAFMRATSRRPFARARTWASGPGRCRVRALGADALCCGWFHRQGLVSRGA